MDAPETMDRDSLRAWLIGQTQEVAVTIAYRAAARVVPLFWCQVPPVSNDIGLTPTATSRALIVASIACTNLTAAVKNAAAAANAAARGATNVPAYIAAYVAVDAVTADADFAYVAARAANSATNAYAIGSDFPTTSSMAFWGTVGADLALLAGQKTGQEAIALPIWSDGENPLAYEWETTRAAWLATGDPGWQFWIDWYDAALEGRPLLGDWDRHWALLTEIALIDPDTWDKGPDAVNPLVARMYAEHIDRNDHEESKVDAAEAGSSDPVALPQVAQLEAITEYGEVIVLNPETGLLRSEPKSELDDYHRDDVLDRLEDALANIDAAGGQNFAYAIILRDMDRLKRILTTRRNRPVRIYQVTLEVVHLIERRAENGECPAVATDPDLSTLVRELYGAAATLQAHDPVVKRFNNPVLHERVNDITDEQARNLGRDLARIPPVSEGLLKDEASEDAERLAKGESDPEVRRNLLVRSISRIIRVYGLVVRSSTAQTLQLAAALYALEPILAPIIRWLLVFLR